MSSTLVQISVHAGDKIFIKKINFYCLITRLTIKSLCPMDLHGFPMDKQSCPLIIGSCKQFCSNTHFWKKLLIVIIILLVNNNIDGYPDNQLLYQFDKVPVTITSSNFPLSQFDIVQTIVRNGTFNFKRGNHSMLQVSFKVRLLNQTVKLNTRDHTMTVHTGKWVHWPLNKKVLFNSYKIFFSDHWKQLVPFSQWPLNLFSCTENTAHSLVSLPKLLSHRSTLTCVGMWATSLYKSMSHAR